MQDEYFAKMLSLLPQRKRGEFRNKSFIYRKILQKENIAARNSEFPAVKYTGKNFFYLPDWQQFVEFCHRERRLIFLDMSGYYENVKVLRRDKSKVAKRVHNHVPFHPRTLHPNSDKDINHNLYYYPDNSDWNVPYKYIEFETYEAYLKRRPEARDKRLYNEERIRVLVRRDNIKRSKALAKRLLRDAERDAERQRVNAEYEEAKSRFNEFVIESRRLAQSVSTSPPAQPSHDSNDNNNDNNNNTSFIINSSNNDTNNSSDSPVPSPILSPLHSDDSSEIASLTDDDSCITPTHSTQIETQNNTNNNIVHINIEYSTQKNHNSLSQFSSLYSLVHVVSYHMYLNRPAVFCTF